MAFLEPKLVFQHSVFILLRTWLYNQSTFANGKSVGSLFSLSCYQDIHLHHLEK